MKKRIWWKISTAICLVLLAASVITLVISNNHRQGIQPAEIQNTLANQSVVYDSDSGILYVGTHDNKLLAYSLSGEEIWTAEAVSAYSSLVYNKSTDLLFAGNEDGTIYIYNAKDGSVKSTISIQRRIISIDVTEDGQKVVAATATGSSKANVLIYSQDGEQLFNKQLSVKQNAVFFTSDEQGLIIANNRGEIISYDLEMKAQKTVKTNYTILQMLQINGHYWAISKNGSYICVDEDLNTLRNGSVTNEAMAIVSSIGVDQNEQFVLVGTEEGYFFILDGNDKQIYTSNLGSMISAFTAVNEDVYLLGYNGLIDKVNAGNILNMNFYTNLYEIMMILSVVFAVLMLVCLVMSFDRLATRIVKLLKLMWKCKVAYIMLLPTFILIFFFNYRGIIIAFIRAFTDWSIVHNTVAKMSFVGFDNFTRMFTEGYFLTGMSNLLILISTHILKTLTIPVAVAYMCYSIKGDKRKYIHRFLFTLPIVVPGVIGAMVWKKFYDPNIGLFNDILGRLGLENLQRVWLGDSSTAIWSVVFMGFPFIGAMAFLVYYGGFINIGHEIVESAMIDGASRSRIFWRIQLPMIRGQISTMLTLTIIGSMQDFNGIYILTQGGPGTTTYVPALELYFNVSQFGNYGYACAMGVVLFIFTMTVTILSRKITQERD